MLKCGSNKETVVEYLKEYYKEGRSDSGNLFFENGILYSYGHHFPIAIEKPIGRPYYYIINVDKYSVTTSMHQGIVKDIVPNSMRIEIPFKELMRKFGLKSYKGVIDIIKEIDIIKYKEDKTIFEYAGDYYKCWWDKTKRGRKKSFNLEKIEDKEYIEKIIREEL